MHKITQCWKCRINFYKHLVLVMITGVAVVSYVVVLFGWHHSLIRGGEPSFVFYFFVRKKGAKSLGGSRRPYSFYFFLAKKVTKRPWCGSRRPPKFIVLSATVVNSSVCSKTQTTQPFNASFTANFTAVL